MIKRIEEYSNLEEFGEDIVQFHVFLQNDAGNEVRIPWMINFSHFRRFLQNYNPDAADYISKVSSGIRSYGFMDSKILQILHSEEFPVHFFIEKYMNEYSEEKIQKHIEWSENLKFTAAAKESLNEIQELIPDMAFSNSRRAVFADAVDEAMQKEVKKFYPDFFDNADVDSYKKYDDFFMNQISQLVTKLNDYFYKESHK
ncbi:hypothetical protein [Frigoriflavimonas asaccharolytica]|uniref:Uncharacterized protein n=1 Tax=Frigoriflavimonas asaccharolytica TaxID=2735899 RepID=A0A8J8GCZ2_9FLAO|nr:hypothetical protein [Frigoriflavimonas asaccharolytica]NRS93472.1 hypothetical protein [Frigoriflavimonas asaccharolytica]